MRWRPLTWALLSAACLLGSYYFWNLGNELEARKKAARQPAAQSTDTAANPGVRLEGEINAVTPASLAPVLPASASNKVTNAPAAANPRTKYRLSNTTASPSELARSSSAILLANALIDTAQPQLPAIPESLKAHGDPGAYLVQSHGPVTDQLRARVAAASAMIVSYFPNNTLLVRGTEASVQQLRGMADVQAVLPFEPYYKLDWRLLTLHMEDRPIPAGTRLNVVGYAGEQNTTEQALQELGARIVSAEPSPFGPRWVVEPGQGTIAELASLPGIQLLGIASLRRSASDLARVTLGVAPDSASTTNFYGLTGENVLVNVSDRGVSSAHPDLTGRVTGDRADSLVDVTGHGTHVASIIAGSGASSSTVTEASGSVIPPTENQFRGMAPEADIFSISLIDVTDYYMQTEAGKTNALISNNSWYYDDADYDIAAASYDAAVRDTLPEVTGPQAMTYVFPAGNEGNGNDSGEGGAYGTILAPGTAKNVITVAAAEQLREITNEVETVIGGETNSVMEWLGMTDTANEVAYFSSRGNVGVGIEGDFGRFKPDVVAPGTFVIGAKSKEFNDSDYYDSTFHHTNSFIETLEPGFISQHAIFLPYNVTEFSIEVTALHPDVDLPIFVRTDYLPDGTETPVATNFISYPSPTPNDTYWFYGIANPTNVPVRYVLTVEYASTNDLGNYFDVLKGVNENLGEYMYESGTSMAAASISGLLALVGDYFTNTLKAPFPSPALMKAMLINGARTVNAGKYDLRVQKKVNAQGWGLPMLTTVLPPNVDPRSQGADRPAFLFDQSTTNALATGDRRSLKFQLNPAATNAADQPLRVTLVWTDPPGNPAAGLKLVNDLDLIVTNLDTGEIFYGNDFPVGSSFTFPWLTNMPPNNEASLPNIDNVNNVENVFIAGPVATNYSVTVFARSVNVNAVTTQSNRIAQDFALVISSGDGVITNALRLVSGPSTVRTAAGTVTTVANQFGGTNAYSAVTNTTGGLLLNQRVGANPAFVLSNTIPLGTNTVWGEVGTNGVITLGLTNQWHFYVLENTEGFTNAAFATFTPETLSIPRMGVTNYGNTEEATRREADIDLYVSRDPKLLQLDPAVLESADKALGRAGTEVITYSNAVSSKYYVGVHSEDQQASEYSFFGVFSELPFSTTDSNGVQHVRGINVPAAIPDGLPSEPGGITAIGIALTPTIVRRVVVTNDISHQNVGDLLGVTTHNGLSAVLNNHSYFRDADDNVLTNAHVIFDDSGENNIKGPGLVRRTDGPGGLNGFIGEAAQGLWMLTEIDNALLSTGMVNTVSWRIEPEVWGDGIVLDVEPNSFAYTSVAVPVEATNLTIEVLNESATPLPMELYVRRGSLPTLDLYDHYMMLNPIGTNLMSINTNSFPPLQAGRYYIGIYNPNGISQRVRVRIRVDLDISAISPLEFPSPGSLPIADDAVTYSTVHVTNRLNVAEIWADVQIEHERVSDLALTLVSPGGKRILLFENRGGTNDAGLGNGPAVTNVFPVTTPGQGTNEFRQDIALPVNSGTVLMSYNFYDAPDTMRVYADGQLIKDTGLLTGTNLYFTLNFGPLATNVLTIVINEGGNVNDTTIWDYTPTVVQRESAFVTFTDNTNFAQLPIKFAVPPYLGTNTTVTNLPFNGLFYLPEEPMKPLIGDSAFGDWQLEMWDSRAGATNLQARLVSWQLRFIFEIPPLDVRPLYHGVLETNSIPACDLAYYYVDVPTWANFATNTLVSDVPVNLWYSTNGVPSGTNATDVPLALTTTNLTFVLATNSAPPLIPGSRYFLAVENLCTNATNANIAIMVEFDVTQLTNAVSFTGTNAGDAIPRYFSFDVSSNATAVQFQLTNMTANFDLVARRGGPLPTLTRYEEGSFNPGTTDEEILIFSNSVSGPLGPGRWYLGVYNRDLVPGSYTIVASEFTNAFPDIITLTNGVPYANALASGVAQYYRYVVSGQAARVQFEINHPTGDMTLVARKGLPLPDLGLFDYRSANAVTNDELIIVFTNSAPVALSPGNWFLTAVNTSSASAAYEIVATEWGAPGLPIRVIGTVYTPPVGTNQGSFCITWESLPGMHYYLQGITNLSSTNWNTLSPTITAVDVTTTFCVPLPSDYQFFRLQDGIVLTEFLPLEVSISRVPAGFFLEWNGAVTDQYEVQWTPSLLPPQMWNTFTNTITSTNGVFSFLDDGSQTGGLDFLRFYRVQPAP